MKWVFHTVETSIHLNLVLLRKNNVIWFKFLPICAGAIISDQSILTNAVCATVCNVPSECKVFVGRVNIRSGGKELTIKGSVWHNSYIEMRMIRPRQDELINIHDIGIIHVEPIQLSESVQIISLPKQTLNGETPVRLAGWGNSLHMDVVCTRFYFSHLLFSFVHWITINRECTHFECYPLYIATSHIAIWRVDCNIV